MKAFSRRDMLKTSLLAPAVAVAAHGMTPIEAAMQAAGEAAGPLPAEGAKPGAANQNSQPGAGRERLLLDFGWRFHFGHADDADQGFRLRQRTVRQLPEDRRLSSGRCHRLRRQRLEDLSICRTTGPSSCPSRTIPRCRAKASIRWAATIPRPASAGTGASSIFPPQTQASGITIEFDGAYRETMVVFNGFYIGRHSGGYDPFSFDVTDFANPGGTQCAAGPRRRHVERRLVLRGRGHLPARVAGQDASGAREEVGHVRRVAGAARAGRRFRSARKWTTTARRRQNARVISTILDPAGKAVGQDGRHGNARSPRAASRPYEQKIDGEAAGAVVARRAQSLQAGDRSASRTATSSIATKRRFGIRTIKFDAEKGLLPERQVR